MYLSNRLPSLFDDPFFRSFFEQSYAPRRAAGVFPAVNVYDDGKSFLVRAELPGVLQSSLELTAEGEELTIAGERAMAAPAPGASEHRKEAWTGAFRRTVTLPALFDSEKIEAKFKDGVLEVVLPRHQSVAPRKIAVG